jgi:hypothetical protein
LDKYVENTPMKDQVDKQIMDGIKGHPFYQNVSANEKVSLYYYIF